jgi:hypothetical protein
MQIPDRSLGWHGRLSGPVVMMRAKLLIWLIMGWMVF